MALSGLNWLWIVSRKQNTRYVKMEIYIVWQRQADVTVQHCLLISVLTSLLQSAHTVRSVSPVAVRRGQCGHQCNRNVAVGCSVFSVSYSQGSSSQSRHQVVLCLAALCLPTYLSGWSFHISHSRFFYIFFSRFTIHWTPCQSPLYNLYSWPIIYRFQIHFNIIRLSTCR